jgi:hypothetical protein
VEEVVMVDPIHNVFMPSTARFAIHRERSRLVPVGMPINSFSNIVSHLILDLSKTVS